jgi:tetratricopeptide (TPR) repeat protein
MSNRESLTVLLLACLFMALPGLGLCDALMEPPGPWQDRLQAMGKTDLSGAEPYARKVIEQQRDEVARLLQDTGTGDAELAEAYGRLGALYQVYHLPAAAQVCYANAMGLAPNALRWVYYAGYLASRNGRHAQAVELYLKARQLQPDYAPLALRLGQSRLELDRLEEASSDLQTAAQQPGLRAMALYLLAQIDLLQRRFTQAVERLQQVLRLDPEADRVHYPLARALRAQGHNDEARRQLALQGKRLPRVDDPLIQDLEGLDQGARRFFAEGLRASRRQDYTAAAEAFAQGLEIEPDNPNARVSYARALFLSGQAEQAQQQLQRVLTEAPELTLARFLSAILLEQKGDASAAMQDYQEVLQQEPNHYGAHYCLANRLYQTGDFAQAAEHYSAALKVQPNIPPARLNQLLALKQSGVTDKEILDRLQKLITAHPEQQILRYIRIRLLLLSEDPRVRDLEQARQQVNELVREAYIPPHVELQARVAAILGHFQQAVDLQQQVLPALQWMDEDSYEQGKRVLAAYRRQELPEQVWYRDDRLLVPPRTDVGALFQEYPSAVPY